MSKPLVLLVEDDQWLAASYTRQLEAGEYRVVHVDTAEKAIDAADDHNPHVIILDMLLGRANGLTLLHELQSHHDMARIPVIILSTLGELLPAEELKTYGVVSVLDKASTSSQELVVSIRKQLI